VIVVDSSALVAILKREAEHEAFRIVIAANRSLVSSVSILEISIVIAGSDGDRASWTELDDLIRQLRVEIRPHDAALTDIARQAFLRFGKGRHPARLNFGDCASYALAKAEKAALLFKGDDFSQTDIAAAV
jgi:ribonuclease VapC